jgi:diguanylate cyclase (GGDEF)-like protein
LRILYNFLIPGAILTAVAVYFLNSPYLQYITRFQVDFAAAILVMLCALLAWRFDRARILYIIQTLLYADIALHLLSGPQLSTLLTINVIYLLANISIVALLKERGIHSMRGLIVSSAPLIQALLFLYMYKYLTNFTFPSIETSYLNLPAPFTLVPEPILGLIILTVMTQFIRFLRYPTPLEGALIWVIIGVIISLFYPAGMHTTLIRAASILTLLIAFMEMSHTLAYKDELTGIPGRRALMEEFRKLGSRYSIAMVDIDFFKKFNDTHGHDVGDQVLKMVAMRLAKCTGGGRVFRYGGEEFCIVFAGKSVGNCMDSLELVRSRIADQPFSIRKVVRPLKKPKKSTKSKRKNNTVKVTVSIGVAEKTSKNNQPELVMKQSDLALYRAKNEGRNKVCA